MLGSRAQTRLMRNLINSTIARADYRCRPPTAAHFTRCDLTSASYVVALNWLIRNTILIPKKTRPRGRSNRSYRTDRPVWVDLGLS